MNNDEFSYKLFIDNVFKELVKALLEDFGYIYDPVGYKTSFRLTKKELPSNNSETARRIRSPSYLLVYDPEISLVEVKMSPRE